MIQSSDSYVLDDQYNLGSSTKREKEDAEGGFSSIYKQK